MVPWMKAATLALALVGISVAVNFSAEALTTRRVRLQQTAPCEGGDNKCALRAFIGPDGTVELLDCRTTGCGKHGDLIPPNEIGQNTTGGCRLTVAVGSSKPSSVSAKRIDEGSIKYCTCKGGSPPDPSDTSCFGYAVRVNGMWEFHCSTGHFECDFGESCLVGSDTAAGSRKCCICVNQS